jgi:integrase
MPQIPFKGKDKRDLFMEPEEFRKLLKATEGDVEATDIFLSMCPGGLRTVEVTWVKVSSLDTGKNGLWVKTAKRKDKWVRFVGLDSDVMKRLSRAAKRKPEASALFRYQGNPVSKRQIRYLFHKYKALAGVRHALGPHSLRHLTGIILSESGSSPQEVANYLGHSNLKQVLVYANLRTGRSQQMARGAGKVLFGEASLSVP